MANALFGGGAGAGGGTGAGGYAQAVASPQQPQIAQQYPQPGAPQQITQEQYAQLTPQQQQAYIAQQQAWAQQQQQQQQQQQHQRQVAAAQGGQQAHPLAPGGGPPPPPVLAAYDASRFKFEGFPRDGPENYSANGIRHWLSQLDLRPLPCGRKPARWVPDAHPSCECCPLTGLQFDWVRRKHHCRLCGGVFSMECCWRRALLPEDMIMVNPSAPGGPSAKPHNRRNPQRVCDICFEAALPLQDYLLPNSNSEQDLAFDETARARYFNKPIAFNMEDEIKKAAYSIRNFTAQGIIKDKSIPLPLLQRAKGLAFITVVKAGFIFTAKVGTGLVIARQRDGSWSAPSAIGTIGAGWGAQVGAEITDYVLILNTNNAVDAFSGTKQFTLGAELSVAVGPLGRAGGSEVHGGGGGGLATIYSYSHSKGLFAGVSLEGSCIVGRKQVNKDFYGVDHDARKLLSGEVMSPPAAMPLYESLQAALTMKGVIAGDFMTGGGGPPMRGGMMGGGAGRPPAAGANALFGGGPPRPAGGGFQAPPPPQYGAPAGVPGMGAGAPQQQQHFATAGDPMGIGHAVPAPAPAPAPAPITISSKYADPAAGALAGAAAPAAAAAAPAHAAPEGSWDGGTIDGGGSNPFADEGTSF